MGQKFSTATSCHKLNFCCASPLSLLVLVGVVVCTVMTRNLAAQIIDDAIEGIGKLACGGQFAAQSAAEIARLQDKLRADPNLNTAKTLFNTYVTGFGAAIVAYQIVFIQLFACCSIYVRNKCTHICSVWWTTVGFAIFFAAGLAITLIYILLESGTSGLPGGSAAPPPPPGTQPEISTATGLNCQFYEKNPYQMTVDMCTNPNLFAPDKYFASNICGKTQVLLRAWAAMMFLLSLTGMFALFSGCCLNGCCTCAPSFEEKPEPGNQMTSIATASQATFAPQPAFAPAQMQPQQPDFAPPPAYATAPPYAPAPIPQQSAGAPLANPIFKNV